MDEELTPRIIFPPRGVNIPTKVTLDKYGLDEQSWLAILKGQGWICPICKNPSKTGNWVVDHEHVRGYKKMSPENKREHIRGICHWWCNKSFVARGISIFIAKNVVEYLEVYEEKKKARNQ